ncbi:hypothetical protein GGQ99_005049 [Aminobacter niigataensis]|uniref:Uncharacterized protein n=1 Tax=Aminobacter niigataensis TaxID=83265 RepID=A0ABR6LAK4_9HYPH|nr:hypothetical protein [Aminobacter niigataensis]
MTVPVQPVLKVMTKRLRGEEKAAPRDRDRRLDTTIKKEARRVFAGKGLSFGINGA